VSVRTPVAVSYHIMATTAPQKAHSPEEPPERREEEGGKVIHEGEGDLCVCVSVCVVYWRGLGVCLVCVVYWRGGCVCV
jgi:hypothetical protein